VELTVVPFADAGGRLTGAIGLFFDVSRLEALERVRRDFVADISHELRSPLASVRAAVETLQTGALAEPRDAEAFLSILEKNAARMGAILDDLTDLSLIETGAIELQPERVDLGVAVRETITGLAPRAAARQVQVVTEVPDGLSLRADRRRLDQILTNLVDNAIKFNRQGGGVMVRAAAAGAGVRIAVEDAGPGIPPDALERIFHRFYRLDRSRSRDIPGTGLGLAIVKHLIRLHGGSVRAENKEGGGARFIVELPGEPPPGAAIPPDGLV
jgi:two-component system phosphate regulon sensor histidine kinase PhoR